MLVKEEALVLTLRTLSLKLVDLMGLLTHLVGRNGQKLVVLVEFPTGTCRSSGAQGSCALRKLPWQYEARGQMPQAAGKGGPFLRLTATNATEIGSARIELRIVRCQYLITKLLSSAIICYLLSITAMPCNAIR